MHLFLLFFLWFYVHQLDVNVNLMFVVFSDAPQHNKQRCRKPPGGAVGGFCLRATQCANEVTLIVIYLIIY